MISKKEMVEMRRAIAGVRTGHDQFTLRTEDILPITNNFERLLDEVDRLRGALTRAPDLNFPEWVECVLCNCEWGKYETGEVEEEWHSTVDGEPCRAALLSDDQEGGG